MTTRFLLQLARAAPFLALAACTRDSGSAAQAPTATRTPVPQDAHVAAPVQARLALVPQQLPRCADPRYVEAAHCFERGEFARAKELWLTLPDSLDAQTLGARLHAIEGDEVGAIRALESARTAFPGQSRVYSTAAEIHAAAGRLASAEDEIRDGLVAAGPTADLFRARGVLSICRPGGARVGLENLLEARAKDGLLEFCDRPLAQAHILLGNAALGGQNALDAAGHARAALVAMPDDHDAQQLLADALASGGDFTGALAVYEKLLAQGVDVRGALALLSARGATASLVDGRRGEALERYLRARALGLDDEELGFGLTLLGDEATHAVEAGLAHYESGDLVAARERFEYAMRCDPRSIEAHNHLAVVAFKQTDYSASIEHWRAVLDLAQRANTVLPEPVHLNLARALHQAGRDDEVRAVLDEYLRRAPEGEFAAQTREMVARLERDARSSGSEAASPTVR